MKYSITVLVVFVGLLSCKGSQEITTTPEVLETQSTATEEITTSTGVFMGTTKPISEMEPEPTLVVNDTIVEINPQAFVPQTTKEAFDHTVWNTLLTSHVSEAGNVNYEGFRKESKVLRAYIASLGTNMPDNTWSKNDILSYWMNAYNAMTVDLILRNLPLQSIKDIDKPWDQRLWKLQDKWYNLDEIEHKILRKMDEPRIHFGINCASYSCPPLLNKAFTAKNVEEQLDFLSRQFINDPTRNTITSERVTVSKIFNWFAKDFKTNGTLIDFLNQYATTPISAKAKVRYKDYDWSLNK